MQFFRIMMIGFELARRNESWSRNSFQPDPIYVLYFFWNSDKERDGENVVLVLKHHFLIVRSPVMFRDIREVFEVAGP